MKRRMQNAVSWGLVLVFLFLFLARAKDTRAGVAAGLSLWAQGALPALFPFFVLSGLITRLRLYEGLGRAAGPLMRRVFGLPADGAAALLLGLLGGYPVGAQTAAQLYRQGRLTARQALRLCAFCNNTGPAFLIGMAGCTVFSSLRTGVLLYAIHVLSALANGLIWRLAAGDESRALPARPAGERPPAFFSALTQSVTGALGSCLNLAGFVLFFSCLLALLPQGRVFLPGVVELTAGVMALQGAPYPLPALLIAASFFLAFGSLSVLCQTIAVLDEAGLDALPAVLGKLLHGVLAAALTALCLPLFDLAAPAFAPLGPLPAGPLPALGLSLLLCLPCVLVLILLEKTLGNHRRHGL